MELPARQQNRLRQGPTSYPELPAQASQPTVAALLKLIKRVLHYPLDAGTAFPGERCLCIPCDIHGMERLAGD
ncbi:hypothetical protein NDU88_005369 [Pleurodeles waltl]|uniref:Uncharacterized protein n=1 Tax=Pleurodeles waltl TaxID=8319 RepID=A0AAV7TTS2_PLEWA|nr:hypothetical protein NDU88_005369 [Pleurodeles waltl]